MNQKIEELQLLEHNLQNSLMQHQQIQNQIVEIGSAQKELESTNSAYKIIGNIMVASDSKKLTDELSEKKKILDLRLKSLEKQESQLREKATELKKEVMSSMEGKDGSNN